jgi:hypothetical protein
MKRLALVAALTALLAAGAVTAVATAHTASGTTAAAAQQNGTVKVRLDVKKFFRTGHRLVARGTAIATYTPQNGAVKVTRAPFAARVSVAPAKGGAATVCPVLTLQIDQISLDLLGLHVDVSKLILTVTANRDGGALGKLFCSLSEAQLTTNPTNATASKLTSVAHNGGLATKGVGFGVPTRSLQAIGPGPCSIVDLLLGPLHLDLLGLVVDLNQVHLQITAAPNGGILGSLLCSLTNPTTSTTTTTAAG